MLSKRERSARSVTFDQKTTVVLGENDTGKSSLIKSIYASFGANPAVIHPDWKGLGVTTMVEFDVDSTPYQILRSSGIFALFDAGGKKLWSASGITSQLAPQLAEILGIKLKMQSREGEFVTPPPAYFFAPFYVDQDRGWQRNWNSFTGMQQFEKPTPSLALFHAGVRPNEFYAAQAEKIEADCAKSELSREREALERTAKRLRADRRVLAFDLRPEAFGDRLEELTRRASALRAAQDKVRSKLAELHSSRVVLVEQIEIARASLAELDADFAYLRTSADTQIICPTCGTLHQNDFANKFSLIADVDTCRLFVLESQQDLSRIKQEITSERERFSSFGKEIAAIEAILNETKNDVRLRDILESESERMIDEAFNKERQNIDFSIGEKESTSQSAATAMKKYKNRKREKQIKDFFSETLNRFTMQLQVPTLPDKLLKSLYYNPPETGSDQPRALLAYYYAYANTVCKFSSALIAPLVIDSPVQQDQDSENAKRIIQFALDNVPDGMQLILGSVRLHDVPYAGHRIELTDKRRLLRSEEYDEVHAMLAPLLDSLL